MTAEGHADVLGVRTERREGASGACELPDEDARAALDKPFLEASEFPQPDGDFEPEGDGDRVLIMRAPRHDRVLVAQSEVCETAFELLQSSLDEVERSPDLQHGAAVHDVVVAPQWT